MTLQTIFFTQVASIISFIVALFGLYKLLVSTKDATIESLKQQNSYSEQKVKDLLEQEPDLLLQRYKRKIEAYEEELKQIELESNGVVSTASEKIEKIEDELMIYEESFEKAISISHRRRDSAKLRAQLIQIYDGTCQVCSLKNPSLMHACHIKPITNNGDSSLENMLLLCPNDHAAFDRYKFSINDDLSLAGR